MEKFSVLRLLIFCSFLCLCDCYLKSVYDTLADLNCSKFRSVIDRMSEGQRKTYQHREGNDPTITLFAFNDTAFDAASDNDRSKILSLARNDADEYVKSLTVDSDVGMGTIQPNTKMTSLSSTYRIYLHRRIRGHRNVYFVNGAEIIRSETRAIKGVVYLLDRLLLPAMAQTAYGYLKAPKDQPGQQPFKFESRILQPQADDSLTSPMDRVDAGITLFLPTDSAVTSIPQPILDKLFNNMDTYEKVIKQHMILNKVIYPSFIESNDKETSAAQGNDVIFQRDIYGRPYVTSGGTVEITGHVTVSNGVIVFVEGLLGLQYRNAWEQLQIYANGSEFRNLVARGRSDLSASLQSPSGVTLFVPSNRAMDFVRQLPGVDNFQNQTLSNMVLELNILPSGNKLKLGHVTNDYNSPLTVPSQHSDSKILVYRQGQDLWVEGGYVRARVILPDVSVSNGIVHYLDDVMGVPSRDLPATIECDDWLLMTSYYLNGTGLAGFMKDHAIRTATPPCLDSDYRRHFRDKVKAMVTSGHLPRLDACSAGKPRCHFTLFVVNGSAMEAFPRSQLGQKVMADLPRLQYIFRRHLVFNHTLYLNKLTQGSHTLRTHTGEELGLQKGPDSYRGAVYTLTFRKLRINVIHPDIGATNGVVHVVDNLVVGEEDLHLDISRAGKGQAPTCILLALALTVVFSLV